MSRRPHGLTLIELVVALAVFAVLGMLTYRGTTQLMDSRHRLGGDLERWRAIERAMSVIETDLQQIAAPQPVAGSAAPLELLPGGDGTELRLLSLASAHAARRIAFRHTSNRLEWVRWPGRDASGPAQIDILLDRVAGVRWRFLGSDGWTRQWPPSLPSPPSSRSSRSSRPDGIPAGVELQLDLPDAGTLTRLYALR